MSELWTEVELRILRCGMTNGMKAREIALALPGRTIDAIHQACHRQRPKGDRRPNSPNQGPGVQSLPPDEPGIDDQDEDRRRQRAMHGDALFASRLASEIRCGREPSAKAGTVTAHGTKTPKSIRGSAIWSPGSPAAMCAEG